MKYLPLIWAGLWRKPLRTTLTFLAIVAAFMLFGLLQGIGSAFDQVVASSDLNRLYIMSRINNNADIALPISQLARIRSMPGVVAATPLGSVTGYYQDPRNYIFPWAVDADSFFTVYPEIKIAPDQAEAWRQNRASTIIGSGLAAKYGWKIGDRVPLKSSTLRADGGTDWSFEIVGIFDAPAARSYQDFSMRMAIHYDTFNESLPPTDRDQAFVFIARVADGVVPGPVAAAIDAAFANSADETETGTEKDYASTLFAQIGNIKLFILAIILAVFFTLLFVTGNTVAQSTRERIGELAILKSLGFSDGAVQGIILLETLILYVTAAVLGLVVVWAVFPFLKLVADVSRPLQPGVVLWGVVLAAIFALATGYLPARRIGRVTIVDALAAAEL